MIELAPVFGIIGLGCALNCLPAHLKQLVGTERIHEIAEAIHEGAMAFLRREYVVLAIFVLIVTVVLSVGIDLTTATAFVFGSVCSILVGFLGMKAATRANARTT
jgi:K(+)-stimulated pyrophosphate-energized sodium pump